MAGKSVIPANEMVQKVKAAVDARLDPDFIIIARTDSAGTHGVDEAIRRLNLYAEAGADCMYADALLSSEDIAKVAKGVPKPLIVNMGRGMRTRKTTPLMTPKELEALGVAVVSYPRLLTTAALKGMMNAMTVFKEEVVGKHRVVDRTDLQVSFEEINDLMGMAELDELGGGILVVAACEADDENHRDGGESSAAREVDHGVAPAKQSPPDSTALAEASTASSTRREGSTCS